MAKCLANTCHSIFKCLLGNKQAFLSSQSGHTYCDSFMRCEVPDVLKYCSDTVL